MLPKMIPDKPSPFNLDLTKKSSGTSQAVGTGDRIKDLKKFGDTADKGIGSVVNGLFESVFGGGGGDSVGAGQVGMLGDFDSEQFVESTLQQHQGKKSGDGGGIGEIIGSLMKMFAGGGK